MMRYPYREPGALPYNTSQPRLSPTPESVGWPAVIDERHASHTAPVQVRRRSSYHEAHKTDMLAIRGGEEGTLLLCLDCAITDFFGGSLAALEDIDYGKATRGQDREGYPYLVVHYANVERDPAFRRDSRLICTQDGCRREIYTHEPI